MILDNIIICLFRVSYLNHNLVDQGMSTPARQGDQKGRIFANVLGVCLLRTVFENYRSSLNFGLSFICDNTCMYINIDKVWVGQHFGRFFSQTHLATLHSALWHAVVCHPSII
jgi:hypothetical protein